MTGTSERRQRDSKLGGRCVPIDRDRWRERDSEREGRWLGSWLQPAQWAEQGRVQAEYRRK